MSARFFLLLFALPGLFPAAASALQFTGMEPGYGAPGDPITIGGDFDPLESYSVKVNGLNAAIVDVETDSLVFTIPVSASTGPVTVTFDGIDTTYRSHLTVTQEITVTLDPALPAYMDDYLVATIYDESPPPGPNYPATIVDGEVTYVTATGSASEPGLVGIATGSLPTLQLSAETTALALLFTVPQVFTIDPDEAESRLDVLAGLTETDTVTQVVEAGIAAATDYLEDPGLDAAILAAVEAYLDWVAQNPAPTEAPELAQGGAPDPIQDDFVDGVQSFAEGYPADLFVPGFEPLNALEASAMPAVPAKNGVPTIGVKMEHAPLTDLNDLISGITGLNPDLRGTALEWLALAYELDPSQPTLDTSAEAEFLEGSHTAKYQRLQYAPVSRRLLSAKPVTGYADILGTISDMLFDKAFPVFEAEKDVQFPADRSGLYLIRSFSGARFPPQANLFDPATGLPGARKEDLKMMALNIAMAANETAGIILKAEDVIGDSAFAEIIGKLEVAIATAAEQQLAVGDIDATFVWTLFTESVKLLTKEVTDKMIGKALEAGLTAAAPKLLGKVVLQTLNVPGKLVGGLKVAERIAALSNLINLQFANAWMAQASQSTLVVVGDPWQPEITSFSPVRGHRGRIVAISGRRFSPVAADNIVTFGGLTTDPENPTTPQKAEVLEAGPNLLKVRVPREAATGPITVAIATKGWFSTTLLAPPYHEFVVLEKPVITGFDPDPPPAGGLARILGSNFATGYGINIIEENVVRFASSGATQVPVQLATPTSLLVRVPDTAIPNSVTVVTEGCPADIIAQCTSDPFPFTAAVPPNGDAGGSIFVTSSADNTTADGAITLREAMLIASGNLGRLLTEPPNPRPPNTTYESDFATLAASGASKRDTILLHASYPGGTIALGSALPALENFDRYQLPGVVVDGTAVAGAALVVNGKNNIVFEASGINPPFTTFQNFGGHGLHLSGGAHNNVFNGIVITNCGGDGVYFDTSASDNGIEVSVTGCDGHGIHLSGASVEVNDIGTILPSDPANHVHSDNGGFGLLLEQGANANRVFLGHTRSNALGGVRVTGTGTEYNRIVGAETDPVEVFDNGGPGVWVDVPNTYVHGLNIAGNTGDGVLVEGAGTHDVKVEWIFGGYVYATNGFAAGTARANTGHGIHFRSGTHDNQVRQAYLGGNAGHGILIDGADVHHINVRSGYIGRPYHKTGGGGLLFFSLANGKSGIALTGGTHDNTIGDPVPVQFGSNEFVRVMNHLTDAPDSGAGILISGANTVDNLVFGSILGGDGFDGNNFGNRYGIRITAGAHSNVIGRRGWPGIPSQPSTFMSHNLFQNNTVAGILLESGGSLPGGTSTGEPQTPEGGNVIQNNYFGHGISSFAIARANEVGILIREGGVANRIGGSQPGDANYFWDNNRAGIEIEGAVITRPDLANRIVGNVFQNQGSRLALDTDALAGAVVGAGVLISGGASGHVIGGTNPGESNRFVAGPDPNLNLKTGNVVGVYIDASSNNQVLGNDIGGDGIDAGNILAGVVIRDGTGNVIGPDNRIGANGYPNTIGILGGVVISGGSGNQVIGNRLGPAPGQAFNPANVNDRRNAPHGVLIVDSPSNVIGDQGAGRANVIVNSQFNAIRIQGESADGNQVANNLIGVKTAGEAYDTSNGANGVLVTLGADDTIIGGLRDVLIGNTLRPMPAGNTIHDNNGDGVRIEANSVGNTITYNSITAHTLLGIQNTGGGNGELPPPLNLAFSGTAVSGTVTQPAVPNDSLVQVFSDPDTEGYQYLGEALVAGGAFSIPVAMMAFTKICATVTHASNGNTSEFSCFTPVFTPGLDIRRMQEPPASISAPPGEERVIAAIRIATGENPALVESVEFVASGTADESSALDGVSLYLDGDDDGQLSATDSLLAGPVTIASNNGVAAFAGFDASIPSETVQRWLLVVSVDAGATLGQTLEFTLLDNTKVTSRSVLPSSPITETGGFPLVSDLATIGTSSITPQDIQDAILTGAGYDPDMDINGDGVVDVADVVAAAQP